MLQRHARFRGGRGADRQRFFDQLVCARAERRSGLLVRLFRFISERGRGKAQHEQRKSKSFHALAKRTGR